jgi:hypothetical protein
VYTPSVGAGLYIMLTWKRTPLPISSGVVASLQREAMPQDPPSHQWQPPLQQPSPVRPASLPQTSLDRVAAQAAKATQAAARMLPHGEGGNDLLRMLSRDKWQQQPAKKSGNGSAASSAVPDAGQPPAARISQRGQPCARDVDRLAAHYGCALNKRGHSSRVVQISVTTCFVTSASHAFKILQCSGLPSSCSHFDYRTSDTPSV